MSITYIAMPVHDLDFDRLKLFASCPGERQTFDMLHGIRTLIVTKVETLLFLDEVKGQPCEIGLPDVAGIS
ncbi:hypothetical protein D3C87_1903990 [compost metagenome]